MNFSFLCELFFQASIIPLSILHLTLFESNRGEAQAKHTSANRKHA